MRRRTLATVFSGTRFDVPKHTWLDYPKKRAAATGAAYQYPVNPSYVLFRRISHPLSDGMKYRCDSGAVDADQRPRGAFKIDILRYSIELSISNIITYSEIMANLFARLLTERCRIRPTDRCQQVIESQLDRQISASFGGFSCTLSSTWIELMSYISPL